jgi:hypothetical protein
MPPKKKKKEYLKTKHIDVRVSESQYEQISLKAKMTGLNNSAYLRNLGMNYPLKSVVDQLALNELIQCRADLGRLGGLFKLWLDGENGSWRNLGDRRYEDISDLVDDLYKKKEEILDLSKKLLNVE